jgi:hypothetical protein
MAALYQQNFILLWRKKKTYAIYAVGFRAMVKLIAWWSGIQPNI